MPFNMQNIQTEDSVNQTLYTLFSENLINCTGPTGAGGSSFDGILTQYSTGPVGFTALNTDTEDPTSTSNINLLSGDTLSDATGAYIQYGNYLNNFSPQTQFYTHGNLLLDTKDKNVIVSGTLTSDYVEVNNSLNLGVYPNNGSITYDEVSLLQGTSIIPSTPFDPTSLTIEQNNGFIWTIDYSKTIYKIDSLDNKVVTQTSLSAFTTPVDLTWSSQSNSIWIITNEGGSATQSSLIRINCDDASIMSSWSLQSLIGNGHANTIIHDNEGFLWLMMGSYTIRSVYKINISDPTNPVAITSIPINNGGSYYGGYYMDTSTTYLYAITNVGFGSPSVLVKILLNSPYNITYIPLTFSGIQYYPATGVVYDVDNDYIWIAVGKVNSPTNLGYNCVIGVDSSNNLVQNISVPNRPNDLTIGGNAIWSANSDKTLSKITLTDFTVTAVIEVGSLSQFILWSNYSKDVWVSSREGSTNGNLVVIRPIPVINTAGSTRLLTSNDLGNFINAESDLTFDNSTNTLTLGPNTFSTLPLSGVNNLIVSGQDVHPEINTVCYQSSTPSFQPSIVQHFSRGTITEPQIVQQGDILGQYFSRGMSTGPSGPIFMNTSMINFITDYTGVSGNCVGGIIDFRTRGDADAINPGSYGYSRATINNSGQVNFNDTVGNIAYTFPQIKPSNGQVLCATGPNGQLNWQGGSWLTYTPILASPSGVFIRTENLYFSYTTYAGICTGNGKITITGITGGTPGTSDPIIISTPIANHTSSVTCGSGMIISGTSITNRDVNCLLSVYVSSSNFYFTCNSINNTDTNTMLNTEYLPTIFGNNVSWSTSYTLSFSFSFNTI